MASSAKYLRAPEAADYVGLNKSTLDKLRVSGKGPRFARLGRAVVYPIDELDTWISERLVNSTSEAA
jgi:predicted DNA-binding transcriptional regulator AlpA